MDNHTVDVNHAHRNAAARRVPGWAVVCALSVTGALIGGIALVSFAPPLPVTAVALGQAGLSSADLASWSVAPESLDESSTVVQACRRIIEEPDSADPGNTSLVHGDRRGEVSSIIVQNEEYVAWCVGTDGNPMYLLLDGPDYSPLQVAPGQATVGPSGAYLGPDGYAFAAGRAGAEVSSVQLHEDGVTVDATVGGGWWTAWWPSDDDTALLTGTVNILTSEGSEAHRIEDLRG